MADNQIIAKSNKRRKVNNTQTVLDLPRELADLPSELVFENILTRMPVQYLLMWGIVCKQWYYTIYHDPHFAFSYTLQSSKDPRLLFSFLNFTGHPSGNKFESYFLTLIGDQKKDYGGKVRRHLRKIGFTMGHRKQDVVGCCNGWICISEMGLRLNAIDIFNFGMNESLCISPPIHIHEGVVRVLCSGFGYDSLTKEYKVVLLLNTVNTHEQEYKCMVFTLGTNSWRETTNPPPSHQQISNKVPYSKSAVVCGGSLFWRTREPNEMLLSFDLHNETFQVIPIPAQCVFTTSEQQKSVHLLDTQGSLCVAYLERILGGQNNSCKVHLHVLKDKVKQLWIKETFLLPCSLSRTARTRIVGFTDRVLLSWYDGSCHQIYDLHTKHVKVIQPYLDNGKNVFKKQGHDDPAGLDEDQVVYYLHSHVKTVTSLQTVLPDGARKIDAVAREKLFKQGLPTPGGFLSVQSQHFYTFN